MSLLIMASVTVYDAGSKVCSQDCLGAQITPALMIVQYLHPHGSSAEKQNLLLFRCCPT
jgi:hypothetical protein